MDVMMTAEVEVVIEGLSLFSLSVMIIKTSCLLKHLWHLMPRCFTALPSGREKCVFFFTTHQPLSIADSLGLVLNHYK